MQYPPFRRPIDVTRCREFCFASVCSCESVRERLCDFIKASQLSARVRLTTGKSRAHRCVDEDLPCSLTFRSRVRPGSRLCVCELCVRLCPHVSAIASTAALIIPTPHQQLITGPDTYGPAMLRRIIRCYLPPDRYAARYRAPPVCLLSVVGLPHVTSMIMMMHV